MKEGIDGGVLGAGDLQDKFKNDVRKWDDFMRLKMRIFQNIFDHWKYQDTIETC